MRIERAVDAFLDWFQVERDATPRTLGSYRGILEKLCVDHREILLPDVTTELIRETLNRWRDSAASTRCNVISVFHSFFAWAESKGHIDADPARKIRRPPKKKPRVLRPSAGDLVAVRDAARGRERLPILLMEGAGVAKRGGSFLSMVGHRLRPRTGGSSAEGGWVAGASD